MGATIEAGATVLARQIETFYAERGITVSTRVEKVTGANSSTYVRCEVKLEVSCESGRDAVQGGPWGRAETRSMKMRSPRMKRPAALVRGRAKSQKSSTVVKSTSPAPGQLIDRYGHVLSEAVLHNWSEAALKALGVRRVPEGRRS
jgi:hypothetical protein